LLSEKIYLQIDQRFINEANGGRTNNLTSI